ncbi:hypothetical protein BSKO_10658 [Bryopsis sp. KO-2023]|nr:hypothetical protein BSKO_10658 [Bryopsis sp. KO-2023]
MSSVQRQPNGNAPPNISQDCFSFLFSRVGKDEDHVAEDDRPYVLQITGKPGMNYQSFSDSISTRWNGYLEEVMLVLVHDCKHWMYACVPHDDRRATSLNAGTYLSVGLLRIMEYMPGKTCILLKDFEVIWSEKPSKRPSFPVDISKLKPPSHGIVDQQHKKPNGAASRITTNATPNSVVPTGFQFRDCTILPRNPPTAQQKLTRSPTKNDANANNSKSKRILLQQPVQTRSYFTQAEVIDRARLADGSCAGSDRSQRYGGGHPLQDRMNRCPEGFQPQHQRQHQHNNRVRPDMRNYEQQQKEAWMRANQTHFRQENPEDTRWKYNYVGSIRSGAPNGVHDRQTKKKPKKPKFPMCCMTNEEMAMNYWRSRPTPTAMHPPSHIPQPPKIPPPKPIVLDPHTGRPINAPYAVPNPPPHAFQANWHQNQIINEQLHPSTYMHGMKSYVEPVYSQHVQFCGHSSQNVDRRSAGAVEEVPLRNPGQLVQNVGNDNSNVGDGCGDGGAWNLGNIGFLNQGNMSGAAAVPDWNECQGAVEYQVAAQGCSVPIHGSGEKPNAALEMEQAVFGRTQKANKQVENKNIMVPAPRVPKQIESSESHPSPVSGSIGARYGPITRPDVENSESSKEAQGIAQKKSGGGAAVGGNPGNPFPRTLASPRNCQDDIMFGSFRPDCEKSKGKAPMVESKDGSGVREKKTSKKIGAKPRRTWSDVVKDK